MWMHKATKQEIAEQLRENLLEDGAKPDVVEHLLKNWKYRTKDTLISWYRNARVVKGRGETRGDISLIPRKLRKGYRRHDGRLAGR